MAPWEGSSFLRSCIDKKRSMRDVHEALGIFRTSFSDFTPADATDLNKEIETTAAIFCGSHADQQPQSNEALLMRQDTFRTETDKLEKDYGAMIRRCRDRCQEQLELDGVSSDEVVHFYIHCWIVACVVATYSASPRKGKQRKSVGAVVSEAGPSNSFVSINGPQPQEPFRASEARMVSTPPRGRPVSPSTRANTVDAANEVEFLGSNCRPTTTTSPNKRKATLPSRTLDGKLSKVARRIGGNMDAARSRQPDGDVYDVPETPPSVMGPPTTQALSAARSRREGSADTDPSYVPSRQSTIDHESVGESQRGVEREAYLLYQGFTFQPRRDRAVSTETPRDSNTAPAGDSQDSPEYDIDSVFGDVIRGSRDDTVPSVEPLDTTDSGPQAETNHAGQEENSHEDVTMAEPEMAVQLMLERDYGKERIELFKLILECLIHYRRFHPTTYEGEAEERMNNLLIQLCDEETQSNGSTNDAWTRQSTAIKAWIDLRKHMNTFRVATGFFGTPGDEWKAYLRGMADSNYRAKACIALIDLKEKSKEELELHFANAQFNDDLKEGFHQLTKLPDCNGSEEFDRVRQFNEELRQWL